MLKYITALLAAATSVGASGALRDGTPVMSIRSDKSLDQISGCIDRAWERRTGQATYVPGENGFSMRLAYSIMSANIQSVLVDVRDIGSARLVTVYSRKADDGPKLSSEIQGCV